MELFKSIAHPTELWALLKFKYGGGKEMVMPKVEYVSSRPQIYLLVGNILSVVRWMSSK